MNEHESEDVFNYEDLTSTYRVHHFISLLASVNA